MKVKERYKDDTLNISGAGEKVRKLIDEHLISLGIIGPLLTGRPEAKSPHEALYFYRDSRLEAVRSGRWKLHLPHTYRTLAGRPGGKDGLPVRYSQAKTGLALFDLNTDIAEQHNVADQHPGVVNRLRAWAGKARDELGDSATKRLGGGVRSPGRI